MVNTSCWQTFPSLTWKHTCRTTEVGCHTFRSPWPFSTPLLAKYDPPGRTRTARLLWIANASTVLRLDALKQAARDAIDGRDVELYKEAVEKIRDLDPADPAAVHNVEWIQATEKANAAELSRLEAELKGYKNNLVKESIRVRHSRLYSGEQFLLTAHLRDTDGQRGSGEAPREHGRLTPGIRRLQ